jgi:integrase
VSRDPLMGVQRPRLEHTEMRSWSLEEARQFLAFTGNDRAATAWALLLSRPLRRGEVAGLRWDAIDFASANIPGRRTRITVDGRTLDSTPKTGAGRRLVPLDDSLVALLRAHETRQKAERLPAGRAWQGQGHVLADELGRALPRGLSLRPVRQAGREVQTSADPTTRHEAHGLLAHARVRRSCKGRSGTRGACFATDHTCSLRAHHAEHGSRGWRTVVSESADKPLTFEDTANGSE